MTKNLWCQTESQGFTKVIMIPLGTFNICTTSHQSIQYLLTYFTRDQSGGLIDQQTLKLAWLKTQQPNGVRHRTLVANFLYPSFWYWEVGLSDLFLLKIAVCFSWKRDDDTDLISGPKQCSVKTKTMKDAIKLCGTGTAESGDNCLWVRHYDSPLSHTSSYLIQHLYKKYCLQPL